MAKSTFGAAVESVDKVSKAKLHTFWQDRIYNAISRLDRNKTASEWAKWTKLADMDNYKRLHFTEAARRDIILDIVGERPVIKLESYRRSEQYLEAPQLRLAEIELDTDENWEAVQRVVNDASLAGIGWLRADWAVPEDQPEPRNLTEAEEAAEIKGAEQHVAELMGGREVSIDPNSAHDIHVAEEGRYLDTAGLTIDQRNMLAAHIEEHKSMMTAGASGQFRLSRVNPTMVVFDDLATEFRYIEWIAEKSIVRVEDVKAHPQYKHTSMLEGNTEVRRLGYRHQRRRDGARHTVDTASGRTHLGSSTDKFLVLWHIYNLRLNRLVVICEDHPEKQALLDTEWKYPGPIHFPLVFDPKMDELEGVSDYKKIAYPSQVREDIQARWVEHIETHSRRKILHTADWLDQNGRTQLADPKQISVQVQNMQGYKVLDDIAINGDAYRIDDVMQENINRFLGASDVHQGVAGGTSSATEASIVDAARGRVVKDRRKKVAAMIKWAITRIFAYYREFGTESLLISRGASPDKDLILDPADITNDLWITVDNDTLSAANAELNRQLIRQAIEVLSQSEWMMEGLGTRGRMEVLKAFLRSQKVMSNPDTILEEAMLEMRASGRIEPAEMAPSRKVQSGASPPTPGMMAGNRQSQAQNVSPGQAPAVPGAGSPSGGGPTGGAPPAY